MLGINHDITVPDSCALFDDKYSIELMSARKTTPLEPTQRVFLLHLSDSTDLMNPSNSRNHIHLWIEDNVASDQKNSEGQ
jgi:hypothetical protein